MTDATIPQSMNRSLAILLALIVAIGVLLPGSARGGVFCLGDSHGHTNHGSETFLLEHCSHDFGLVLPGDEHHDEHCHCTDLPTTGPAIAAVSRSDEQPVKSGFLPSGHEYVLLDDNLGGESAAVPRASPWFDPGREHRLAVVASVCLVI